MLFKFKPYIAFQSTHPVRGATGKGQGPAAGPGISIHAPREGCDSGRKFVSRYLTISIHAPREGCDTGAGPGR